MSSLRNLAESLIGEENVDNFAKWAFGEDYIEMNNELACARAWNKKHRRLYSIDLSSSILYDMTVLTDIWREYFDGE